MKRKIIGACVIVVMMSMLMSSCFTGIESTKKITDKDVEKITQTKPEQVASKSKYNSVEIDSFPNWTEGKSFEVADDNLKRVLQQVAGGRMDTLSLKGKELKYVGYFEESVLDNEPNVNLRFNDGTNEYVYRTQKTVQQIKEGNIFLQVPFLIDLDMVEAYRALLVGKSLYLRTSIWYNDQGEMIKGKKYVKVKINEVTTGDKVFPLRVSFEADGGEKASVYMSTKQSSVQNRMFDNLFSESDIRLNFPLISDENWTNIVNGTVAMDMTKEECRLSLGNPNTIQERPTYDGLQEYWFYTDGMYLMFFDGLLKQYRK